MNPDTEQSRAGLMNARQLAKRLGISEGTYYRRKRLGAFRRFETKAPLGIFRYATELVEQYLAGNPVSQFGRRRV